MYLGVTLEDNERQDYNLMKRINKTSNLFYALKQKFISKKEILQETKSTIFDNIYRSVLTYGCEAWVLTRCEEQNRSPSNEILLKSEG